MPVLVRCRQDDDPFSLTLVVGEVRVRNQLHPLIAIDRLHDLRFQQTQCAVEVSIDRRFYRTPKPWFALTLDFFDGGGCNSAVHHQGKPGGYAAPGSAG